MPTKNTNKKPIMPDFLDSLHFGKTFGRKSTNAKAIILSKVAANPTYQFSLKG